MIQYRSWMVSSSNLTKYRHILHLMYFGMFLEMFFYRDFVPMRLLSGPARDLISVEKYATFQSSVGTVDSEYVSIIRLLN